jgi:hypothetical protein
VVVEGAACLSTFLALDERFRLRRSIRNALDGSRNGLASAHSLGTIGRTKIYIHLQIRDCCPSMDCRVARIILIEATPSMRSQDGFKRDQ